MTDQKALREAILVRLSTVIDPETGLDVVRMRLIEGQAVAEVEGVVGQEIGVVGYVKAEELNTILPSPDYNFHSSPV